MGAAVFAAVGSLPPQARQSMTEQHKLVAEKNALIETVKRLNREVAKLEHFKRNLLQQLQEDTEVCMSTPALDRKAAELPVSQNTGGYLNAVKGPTAPFQHPFHPRCTLNMPLPCAAQLV